MKKLLVIGLLIVLLSSCSQNIIYSNKKYNIIETNKAIFSWAEADTYEKALFQCKKQVIEFYYSEVLNGDPDQDWMAIMTSIFSEEVIDNFIMKDTGQYYVSIKVSKKKNSHLIKRE